MIHSMTGYGKSVLQLPTKKITIEIKSLNSKNLDLNARMPSIYREKELSLRKLIGKQLERGKIDFSLFFVILQTIAMLKLLLQQVFLSLKRMKIPLTQMIK